MKLSGGRSAHFLPTNGSIASTSCLLMPFLQIHVSKFFFDCFLETDASFYRPQTGEYLVYYEFVILFRQYWPTLGLKWLHYLSERPLTQPGSAMDSQNRMLKIGELQTEG